MTDRQTPATEALYGELSESPLPGARYALDVVKRRIAAIEADARASCVLGQFDLTPHSHRCMPKEDRAAIEAEARADERERLVPLRKAAQRVIDSCEYVDGTAQQIADDHALDALRAALLQPDTASAESPLLWWCPAWGTLNATRYHGNDGPDDPNCGKVAYRRVLPDTASAEPQHCEGCGGSISSMGGLDVYECSGIL